MCIDLDCRIHLQTCIDSIDVIHRVFSLHCVLPLFFVFLSFDGYLHSMTLFQLMDWFTLGTLHSSNNLLLLNIHTTHTQTYETEHQRNDWIMPTNINGISVYKCLKFTIAKVYWKLNRLHGIWEVNTPLLHSFFLKSPLILIFHTFFTA